MPASPSIRILSGLTALAIWGTLAGDYSAMALADEAPSLLPASHDAASLDPYMAPFPAAGPAPPEPYYPLPSHQYGAWYRPRAIGLGVLQRCRPDPFRPRGYGNLAARRDTLERMDYHPYVMYVPFSQYGPSYYHRQQWQYRDHHSRADCEKQTRPPGGFHDRLLGR